MKFEASADSVFLACKTTDSIIIQIVGFANYTRAASFSDFIKQTLEQNYRKYCILFKDCSGIDSTCLGVLAGLLLTLKRCGGLCLFCGLQPRQLECVQKVGLDKFAIIVDQAPGNFSDKPCALPETSISKINPDLILDAHKFLLEIDAHNEEHFQDVVALLEGKEGH